MLTSENPNDLVSSILPFPDRASKMRSTLIKDIASLVLARQASRTQRRVPDIEQIYILLHTRIIHVVYRKNRKKKNIHFEICMWLYVIVRTLCNPVILQLHTRLRWPLSQVLQNQFGDGTDTVGNWCLHGVYLLSQASRWSLHHPMGLWPACPLACRSWENDVL